MQTVEIVITEEDAKNAPFSNGRECPLALAVKRLNISSNPSVLTHTITENGVIIGTIFPHFGYNAYYQLKIGVIKEFKTIFTPERFYLS